MTCTHFFIDPIYFSDYIKLTFAAKAREIERKKNTQLPITLCGLYLTGTSHNSHC